MHYPFAVTRFRSPAGLIVEMRLSAEQRRCMPFQQIEGDFWISGFEIDKNGIHLLDTHHRMLIVPDGWEPFVSDRPEDWAVADADGVGFYRDFQEQVLVRDVTVAIRRLLDGTENIENLKLQHPEFLHHPTMRAFLAQVGVVDGLPHRKRGAPRGARPKLRVLELYFHVKLLQLDEKSLPEAIRIALNAPGAELPRKWQKDPRESLRKAVAALDREGWFRTTPYQ